MSTLRKRFQNALALGGLALCRIALGGLVLSAQTPPVPLDLSEANLEDLMNVKVTSVSKREQKLSQAAAAVFVISREDIRRSGATDIPDLLRMAPGVTVERINGNTWAISIRGFNSRYANKVLVLVDGRSLYAPSFSGVYWDDIDLPMENIERIEIIRGPGATVWGANAVNGVIRIITKSAKSTSGGLANARGGSNTTRGLLQYGGAAGADGAYRVFTNSFRNTATKLPDGTSGGDSWNRQHAGFRGDWDPSSRDSVMAQGDLFSNRENQLQTSFVAGPNPVVVRRAVDTTAGNISALWKHSQANGAETSLQAYYSSNRRTDFGEPATQRSLDLDFQEHLAIGGRHDLVWGLGFRANRSGIRSSSALALNPPFEATKLFSSFVQDEFRISDSAWLTAGTKVEHNSYTGLEIEPSVRFVWSPPASHYTVWGAVSRSLRQPSRQDTSIQADLYTTSLGPGQSVVARLFGNPKIKDEELRDFEMGYRGDIAKNLTFDVTGFLSFYRHLQTGEPGNIVVNPDVPGQLIAPLIYKNNASATNYGGEVYLTWNLQPRWRLGVGYSFLHANLRQDASLTGFNYSSEGADFPPHVTQVQSHLNLPGKVEFDQTIYYASRQKDSTVPAHPRVDLRLGRRINESLEIGLVGQNLLRPGNVEFGDSIGLLGTQSVRAVYATVTWRFLQKAGQ